MVQDTTGLLWIGTDGGGLLKYDPDTDCFVAYEYQPGSVHSIPSQRIKDILVDADNRCWVTSENGGLSLYRPDTDDFQTWRIIEAPKSADEEVLNMFGKIAQDPRHEDTLWFQIPHAIVAFDKSRHTFKVIHQPDEFSSISLASICLMGDSIWLGAWDKGLLVYNRATDDWALIDSLPFKHVEDIVAADSSTLWLCSSDGGLSTFNTSKGIIQKVENQSDNYRTLPEGGVYALHEDRGGRLWVCGEWGLSMADPKLNKFDNYPFVSHLDSLGFISEIFETESGKELIICLNSNGFIKYDPEKLDLVYTNQVEHNKKEIPITISESHFIKNDVIWFVIQHPGTLLCTLDIRSMTAQVVYDLTDKIGVDRVFDLLVDSRNSVWISSSSKGAYRYDNNDQSIRSFWYNPGSRFSLSPDPTFLTEILEFPEGRIWITGDGGLNEFNYRTNEFKYYQADPSATNTLSLSNTKALAADTTNIMWVGTFGAGVDKIEIRNGLNVIGHLDSGDGLITDRVHEIVRDQAGNLWFGTYAGLSKLNIVNGEFRNYTEKEGLFDNDCSRSMGILSTGHIYIGHEEGCTIFHPDSIALYAEIPEIVIETISVRDGKTKNLLKHTATEGIDLRHYENSFSIDVGPIQYTFPSKSKLSYSLEGFDKGWIETTGFQTVTYTNIPPGNYTFHAVAENFDGIKGEIRSIPIHITPAYWQTTLFKLILALTFLIAVILISKWRIREVRRQEHLKAQLGDIELQALRSQMNPHFLFNSLNSIKYYVVTKSAEQAAEYIDKFSQLVRMILSNSREHLIPLGQELKALELYLEIESMRFENRFEYLIETDSQTDLDYIQIQPLLLQPFVENAIWHGLLHKQSGNGQLTISVHSDQVQVVITIEDNGIGRQRSRELNARRKLNKKSLGIQLTRERMDLNARLHDSSAEFVIDDLTNEHGHPSGTRVRVIIGHPDAISPAKSNTSDASYPGR